MPHKAFSLKEALTERDSEQVENFDQLLDADHEATSKEFLPPAFVETTAVPED